MGPKAPKFNGAEGRRGDRALAVMISNEVKSQQGEMGPCHYDFKSSDITARGDLMLAAPVSKKTPCRGERMANPPSGRSL